MEKLREPGAPNNGYQSPSARAARFILAIIRWFRQIFTSVETVIPRGRMLLHEGEQLPAGTEIHFQTILLVEDNPELAGEFIETIKKHYLFGSVSILIAYAYDSAVTFFDNEKLDLVIMDADLDDLDGDGVALTRKFLGEQPELIILANSSSRISALKLTGVGAVSSLDKRTAKLRDWLLEYDPVGAGRF